MRKFRSGTHSAKMQAAYDEHGEDSFSWQVLSRHTTREEAQAAEEAMLSTGAYALNSASNAHVPVSTPRSRAKQRAANVGELNPFYGKEHSAETKAAIGAKNSQYERTEEHRRKLSASQKGKKKPAGHAEAVRAHATGCRYYHHPETLHCIKIKGEPPEGYVPGMKPKRK
jgi:hypothetical protein